jgi:hypothetical protein
MTFFEMPKFDRSKFFVRHSTAAIKDTNLPNINISHLKIVQKVHMTLTFSAANLKSLIKNSCVSIFFPRQGNAIFMTI